jgi:glycosyltransferase involved in cell wall biosynthesis
MTPPPIKPTPIRRRILFLHGSDEPYGSDRVLRDLVLARRERGDAVLVLLPDDVRRGWLTRELEAANVEVCRVPLAPARRRYLTPRRLPMYLPRLWTARRWMLAQAREFAPSVIHVNTSALLVAALLPRRLRRLVVWHIHEMVVRPRPARWLFASLPTRRARRVIAISEAVADHLRAVGGRRGGRSVRVVPNGIPDRHLQRGRSQPGGLTVAFIGRLNRWKGHEVLVQAAPAVLAHAPDTRFVLAGEAPSGEEWRSEQLSDLVHSLALGQRVSLLGYCPSDQVMAGADVVVVPSTWPEPFGLVTLEAMRASLAIVASNHGASKELLDGGRCGLLVRPGSAAELSDALLRLIRDPELRDRLGAAARQRFLERYSIDRFLAGVEAVYGEVANSG